MNPKGHNYTIVDNLAKDANLSEELRDLIGIGKEPEY
jgi:hypothetical protein